MNKLIFSGMLRRKKEILPPFIATLIAVIFLTGITLMQEMLNSYLHKSNIENYGDWVVASVDEELAHPYFAENGYITTGEFLVGNDGYRNGLLMGAIGGDFDAIGGNYMQDGRMPEADNEIATNTAVLSEYGYSYELGQTITIRYHNEDMKVMEKDYILVGVVKAFDDIWNSTNNATMPDCYMTEQELNSYEKIVNVVYYYRLNPLYDDVDTWELAESFKTGENDIIYNSFVYANNIWGSEEMYRGVTLAIGIVATLTIGYLLVMYTHKRRPVYFKYRSIGASKLQVRGLVAVECGMITVTAIILGIVASYLLAGIVEIIIARLGNLKGVFEFNPSLFCMQLALNGLIIVLGIIAAEFTISDKKISQNTSEIKHSKFKRLRRAAKRSKHPHRDFLKRRNIISPIQNILFACISAIMFGCMLYCVHNIYETYINHEYLKDRNDFGIRGKADWEYTYQDGDWEMTRQSSDEKIGVGLKMQDLKQLEDTIGVEYISYYIADKFHYYKWNGMDKSENLEFINETEEINHNMDYDMSGLYLTDLASIKGEVKDRGDGQKIDWDKMENGEQAILFVGLNSYKTETNEVHTTTENSIKAGDVLTICNVFTNEETNVEIGAVYFFDEPEFTSSFFTSSYKIVGSDELAGRIAENEGVELRYNVINIYYNVFSSYQATDKQLSIFARNNDLEYYSNAEYLREQYRERMQKIATYGSVFIVMLVAYISIYTNIFEIKKLYLKKQFDTLKQIGMSDRQYIKMFYFNECKTLLWNFMGIVVCYAFLAYGYYVDFSKYKSENTFVYSQTLKDFTDNPVILTKEAMMYGLEHWVYIVFLVVMYLMMIAGTYIAVRRSISKEER